MKKREKKHSGLKERHGKKLEVQQSPGTSGHCQQLGMAEAFRSSESVVRAGLERVAKCSVLQDTLVSKGC